MLRGIAAADALAVVPPGGAAPGTELQVLDLPPWCARSTADRRAARERTGHDAMAPRCCRASERQPAQLQVMRRRPCAALAVPVALATVLLVYFDRAGYNDNADDTVDFLDAVYYATVTLSTTGYGDIAPVSDAPGSPTSCWSRRCACCS